MNPIAKQDAWWEARAEEIVESTEPLPTDEGLKLLEKFIANAGELPRVLD